MLASREIVIEALVFVATLTFIFASYLALRGRALYRGSIQNRLLTPERRNINTREELIHIRRSRSLTSEGNYIVSWLSLNQLVLQSGTRLGMFGFVLLSLGAWGAVFFAASIGGLDGWVSALIGIPIGLATPLYILTSMRDRRRQKFEEQLPDAIDVLVRSLKAGHALAGAIAAVGKHMPAPIGAEFNLTAAEVTYGLDLETAMVNLSSRVGQADLALIVLAVSVQSKTGGNLAEVLTNLSKIIRERFKLRRKAYALAAEGRFSAILLSILPVALFGILRLISPGYYGDIAANHYVNPILGGAVVWMLIGDYIMYKMVRIAV
ncbi:MAG: type II secretion system F family protein [Rhodomicrobium sp.]